MYLCRVPKRRVRELAEQLAEELEGGAALSAEARDALLDLQGDVSRALEADEPQGLSARARAEVQRLEREHPELTALVQRLADALSAVGL